MELEYPKSVNLLLYKLCKKADELRTCKFRFIASPYQTMDDLKCEISQKSFTCEFDTKYMLLFLVFVVLMSCQNVKNKIKLYNTITASSPQKEQEKEMEGNNRL